MFESDETTDNGGDASFINPAQVDHLVRQLIQVCWMVLPKHRKTVAEVDRQVKRLINRALRDLDEDNREFGSDEGVG